MNKTHFLTTALCALCLSWATISVADPGQGKQWHGKKQNRGMAKILKSLGLSIEQKAQIKDIRQEAKADRQHNPPKKIKGALFLLDPNAPDYEDEVNIIAEEKAEHVRQKVLNQGQTYAQIYAVLTPEQQESFRKKVEARSKRLHSE